MIGGAVKHKSLQKFNIALKKASTTFLDRFIIFYG